jgi:hypothetical protein
MTNHFLSDAALSASVTIDGNQSRLLAEFLALFEKDSAAKKRRLEGLAIHDCTFDRRRGNAAGTRLEGTQRDRGIGGRMSNPALSVPSESAEDCREAWERALQEREALTYELVEELKHYREEGISVAENDRGT